MSGSGSEYEVERILRERVKGGKRLFLVRWKGFDAEDDTWEAEENILSKDLITSFYGRLKAEAEAEAEARARDRAKRKAGGRAKAEKRKRKAEAEPGPGAKMARGAARAAAAPWVGGGLAAKLGIEHDDPLRVVPSELKLDAFDESGKRVKVPLDQLVKTR